VVDAEGISPAASHLGIAKSAVSRRIQELEGSLKTQLIYRSTRSFSLTLEGSQFYGKCLQIIEDLNDAEASIIKHSRSLVGTLRVTAPMSFGVLQMSPLIGDFLMAHKDLKLELELNDRMIDIVAENFDVGIRISKFEDSALIGRKISAITHIAVASPNYLKKMGTPKTPDDLIGHKGIVYSNKDPKDYWQFDTKKPNSKVDISKISCSLKINNGDAIREAAIAGLGVAILPSFIVDRAISEGSLKAILQDYQKPPVYLYAIYSSKKNTSAKVVAFVDFLLKSFN
jgi:DNA-binding transcriptional LysR family regulator